MDMLEHCKMQTFHKAIAQGLSGKIPGSLEDVMEHLIQVIRHPGGTGYSGYEDDYVQFSTTCRLPSLSFLQCYLNEVTRLFGVGVAVYTEPGGPYPVLCSLPQGHDACIRIEFCKRLQKFTYLQPCHSVDSQQCGSTNERAEKPPIQVTTSDDSQPATSLSLEDDFMSAELAANVQWNDLLSDAEGQNLDSWLNMISDPAVSLD